MQARPTGRSGDELEAYGHGLAERPEIVALSKADALDPDTLKDQIARLRGAAKRAPLVLSAVSGQGVTDVLRAARRVIDDSPSGAELAVAGAWQP